MYEARSGFKESSHVRLVRPIPNRVANQLMVLDDRRYGRSGFFCAATGLFFAALAMRSTLRRRGLVPSAISREPITLPALDAIESCGRKTFHFGQFTETGEEPVAFAMPDDA
jgi:hypothetical protein